MARGRVHGPDDRDHAAESVEELLGLVVVLVHVHGGRPKAVVVAFRGGIAEAVLGENRVGVDDAVVLVGDLVALVVQVEGPGRLGQVAVNRVIGHVVPGGSAVGQVT